MESDELKELDILLQEGGTANANQQNDRTNS